MRYAVSIAGQFRKNIKEMQKRGFNLSLLDEIVEKIANREKLESKYRDHGLSGIYKGFRECHIKPDWLLLYLVDDEEQVITLVNTGTHSDLF